MRWGDISADFRCFRLGETTISGPVCPTGSMESDSRMGQDLGQNLRNPKVKFPLKMGLLGG